MKNIAVLTIIITAGLLCRVYVLTQFNRMAREVYIMEREIYLIQLENTRLKKRLAEVTSLQYAEQIADVAGFQRPTKSQIIYIKNEQLWKRWGATDTQTDKRE